MHTTMGKSKNFKELAYFLAKVNNQKHSHIGYCGEEPKEIHKTLNEDLIVDGEPTFFEARNQDGEIVAAMGLDIEESYADVWGPFNQTESFKVQKDLWNEILNTYPSVQAFDFLINQENTRQQEFMEEINAEYTSKNFDFKIKEIDFVQANEIKSVLFKQNDFKAFETIHDSIFPNTYYDAKTIQEKINDKGNVLRLLKTDSNQIQGYAYYELDLEMEEAYLDYIGVSEKFRNRGLGTMLLKDVLTEMFSHPQISEISLTVDERDDEARHLYKKVGFKSNNVLLGYRFGV